MKIGALSLFERLHSNGRKINGINIAAWHWKWSITWRWIFSWYWQCGKRGYSRWIGYYRTNNGVIIRVSTPFFGEFHFQIQKNMRWPKHHYRPEYDSRRDDMVDSMAYAMQGLKHTTESNVETPGQHSDGGDDA